MPCSFTFDAIAQLDRDTSTALATIREWRNSLVRVNRIPSDVLSLIPIHLPSQKDRFLVSSVCRHWRRTFLQHGALWSQLFPEKGEAYVKTLLGRAKGSPLDLIVGPETPIETIALLYPRARQIKHLEFWRSRWSYIRGFFEAIPGPLPLLRTLEIDPLEPHDDPFSQPDAPNSSLTPFLSNVVNLEGFIFNSRVFRLLSHFVFPNLTSFELTTAPVEAFNVSELLNFLKASPMLRMIKVTIFADVVLEDKRREPIVVLSNAETFFLTVGSSTGVYDIATHISCPNARETLLQHIPDDFDITPGLEILPVSVSWNTIVHQYTRSPVEVVLLEIELLPDPRLASSLEFRSSDTTVITLNLLVSNTGEDEEDLEMTIEEIGCEVFCQALMTIRAHPLLSNIKSLHIAYVEVFADGGCLRRAAGEFGRLFKSLGPLEVLSIRGYDPRSYLAPFLYLDVFFGTDHPIIYPPIKELEILDPCLVSTIWSKEECLAAIVEFAKSQHERGIPFERVTIRITDPPEAIAEMLRPWVRTVNCEGSR